MLIPLSDARELSDEGDAGENEELKWVECGEWEDDGKYSHQYTVFEHGGKHYQFWVGRTGSYYSHYEYEFNENPDGMVECAEVVKKSKTIEYWGPVAPAATTQEN